MHYFQDILDVAAFFFFAISYFAILSYFFRYAVLVVGIIDANGKFHAIFVCIVSHETEEVWKFVFQTLRRIIAEDIGVNVEVKFAVADAAPAARNALSSIWPQVIMSACFLRFFFSSFSLYATHSYSLAIL